MLNEFLGVVIQIKLRNKSTIEGKLQDFDSGMNLILTNCSNITEKDTKILDKILLRSDNIMAVSLPDKLNSFELRDDASI